MSLVPSTSKPAYEEIWPPEVYQAWEDYLSLGSGRSIMELYRAYQRKLESDVTAPVPCVNLHTLSTWEARYGWKTLAFEYDQEEHQAFLKNRKKVLGEVYSLEFCLGDKMMKKAQEKIDNLPLDEMTANDALKFAVEGAKLMREAREKQMQLEDPAAGLNAPGDHFEQFRSLILANVSVHNYPPT